MDKQINIIVSATINNATQGFKQVSDATTAAQKSVESLSASTDKVSASFSQAGVSSNDMAKGVLLGEASFELLKKGAELALGVIEESIKTFMDSQAQWQLVKTNIDNAGIAYDSVSEKLKNFADASIQLGFADDQTATSVSKFTLVTKDFNQSMQLSSLAMDLARNKNISLEQATNSLIQVIQGSGARALLQYGLSFKTGASAVEVLNELQTKLAGNAKDATTTLAGQANILQAEWTKLQDQMVSEFAPAFTKALQQIGDFLPTITIAMDALGKVIAVVSPIALEALKGIEELIGFIGIGLTNVIGTSLKELGYFTDALAYLGLVSQSSADQIMSYGKKFDNTSKTLTENLKNIVFDTNDVKSKNEETTTSFTNLGTEGKNTAADLKTLTDTYTQITDKQNEFTFTSVVGFQTFQKALTDTTSSADVFTKGMTQGFDAIKTQIKDSQSEVDKLTASLTSAGDAFAKTTTSNVSSANDSFAKIIHDAELAVPDLQKQISDAQANGSDTSALQSQLADKQKIIATSNTEIYTQDKDLQDQLAFLRAQDGKDELTIAFDNFTRKQELAAQEYAASANQIQKEISDAQTKHDALVKYDTEATQVLLQNIKVREGAYNAEATSIANVTAQVQSYSAAISKAGGATGITTNSSTNNNSNGLVFSTASSSNNNGTPNTPVSNYSNAVNGVTINFNNPTVRSNDDLTQLSQTIQDTLSRQTGLAQMGTLK
jgi:hypothetical protein